MSELYGIDYLKSKLLKKKDRVNLRYKYYDQKYDVIDFGISTPPKLIMINPKLGWCTKAVDSLANRLIVKSFENDSLGMQEIFDLNNKDILFDSATLSALISSCSFIYISRDEEGYPKLEVIDGANATGVIDTRTSMLKEGYAILDTDKNGIPTLEAYFTPESTDFYENGQFKYSEPNPTQYPLLVPVIYRPSDKRPFGHSRISRACIDIVQKASRTSKRSEISAEFYSYPQKYIVGLEDGVEIEKWKANMSSMLTIYASEDGGANPTVGQFAQQSMAPHLDQMAELVKEFCGETGLTSDDLGFIGNNPSSAESIKASHETLRLLSRQAQRNFSVGFINAGYLACSLRDGKAYRRKEIYNTKVLWEPIFEPDAAMLSSIGDGAIKINQAIDGYFGKDNLSKLTGIESDS